MTRAEAERAIQAAEAQQVAVAAEWKAFPEWQPNLQQNPDAYQLRAVAEESSARKRPAMTQGEAAFRVEDARRQLAAIDAGPTLEAARRAAAKVEAAKAKVDKVVAEAEKKLAAIREEFIAGMEEFGDLWKQVPEAARDLLPAPFCLVAPYT